MTRGHLGYGAELKSTLKMELIRSNSLHGVTDQKNMICIYTTVKASC
jgi:hypothetical protein